MSKDPLVQIRLLTKSYGDFVAVQPLDLDILAGDFLAILGPSGCGKTTLLRMIGGFASPTAGTIHIDGRDVTNAHPEHRPTNMVFQGYGLFPHMNVRQNVAFGLRMQRVEKSEIDGRVAGALRLVHMEAFGDRRLVELSGGQQQRVALARALVLRPKVLLLDEPLGALDLKLRRAMQEELRTIHREIGGTFVIVTHDQEEAMALAGRIVVMNGGVVEQLGTPQEIYSDPASKFVATFIGDANLLAGVRSSGKVQFKAGFEAPSPGDDGPVVAVVRPEALRIGHVPAGDALSVCGCVEDVQFAGSTTAVSIRLPSGEMMKINETYRRDSSPPIRGTAVTVSWGTSDQKVLADKS